MVLFEMIMQREGEGEVFQGTRIMYAFPLLFGIYFVRV